jgi:transcriptional regulator with XRE-family HTH domain
MRGRRSGPRLGLGRDRVDPERARFRAAADVLRYFSDLHGLTQARLAERCGVRREQMTRWLTGVREPTLTRLAEVIEPLGWTPVIVLERTEAALNMLSSEEPGALGELLEYEVQAILDTVRAAVEAGLDVVVGGEVAAHLQGIPVPTRHLVLHVRPEHVTQFLQLATKEWHDVTRLAGQWVLRRWPVAAEVVAAPVRTSSRIVADSGGLPIPVVDLAELLVDPDGVGPSVRALAARRPKAEAPVRRVG